MRGSGRNGATSRLLATAVVAALTATGCSRSAETFFARAERFRAAGQHAEAVLEYRNALKRNPDLGEAHLRLGQSLLTLKDLETGAIELVRAAQLMPDSLDAQLQAGNVLVLGHRYNEALACARRAMQLAPNSIPAHVLNANALAGLKRYDSAVAALQKAITLDPTQASTYGDLGTVQLAAASPDEAEATFMQAVAANPAAAEPHLTLGSFYWAQGRTEKAEAEMVRALELEPANAAAHRALATFYLNTGRAGQAEQHLRAAVDAIGTTAAQIMLADYYLSLGKRPEATRTLQAVATTKDGYGEARSRLATMAYDDGRTADAHRLIDETIRQDPSNARALLTKGQFLLAERKVNEAFERAKAALAADPRSIQSRYMLASIYALREDPEQAAQQYAEILRTNPQSVAAQLELARLQLARGDRSRAVTLAEQVASAKPGSLDARLLLLRSLIAAGDAGRADGLLRALPAQATGRADVQWLSGMLRLLQGNRAAARTFFERSLELQPDAIEPLDALIALDLASADATRARNRIEAALARHGETPPLLMLAGRVFSSLGDRLRAEELLLKAIAMDPQNPEPYDLLTQVYAAQKALGRAVTELERLAQRSPAAVGPPTMLGTILQAQGKVTEAQRWYEKALAINGRAVVAANNLAWLYVEQGGDLDEALRLAQIARDQLPQEPGINDTLGWVFFKKDQPADAVAPLKQCLVAAPKNPICHYHLGLAYMKNGQPELARASLETAVKLNPTFEGAANARSVLATIQ